MAEVGRVRNKNGEVVNPNTGETEEEERARNAQEEAAARSFTGGGAGMSKADAEQAGASLGLEYGEVRRREQEARLRRQMEEERARAAASNHGGLDVQRDAYGNEVRGRGTPQVNIGPERQAALSIGGSNIDRRGLDENQQFRGGEADLISQLAMQARGQGPSVSGEMLRQAQASNMRNVMAAMAAARGGPGGAAAVRAAQGDAAGIGQQAAGQAAQTRMQEQLNAQGLLGNVLAQARQGDLSAREQNMRLAQVQAQLRLAEQQGNQAAVNALRQQYAQIEAQANLANPQLSLQAEQQRDAIRTALLQAGYSVAEADRQANLAVQGMNQRQYMTDEQIAEARRQSDLGNDVKAQDFLPSDERVKTNVKPAEEPEENMLTTLGSLMPKQGTKGLLGNIVGSIGSLLGGAAPAKVAAGFGAGLLMSGMENKTNIQPADVASDFLHRLSNGMTQGGRFNPIGAAIGTGLDQLDTLSDETKKTDKNDASVGSDQRFLDQLNAMTYDYKNPALHGSGRRLGIMAQDLEKTPEGASLVRDTPGGKVVDVGGLANAAIASVVNVHKRVKDIEARLNKKGGKA